MKGPGIKTYITALEEKKQEAVKRNEEFIDVSSKEVHAEISPNHATMPTCCQAMYKLLLEGDEIIRKPKGQTGFGSRLVVRYYLHNMNERGQMFPAKKRGRPAKSEEEKRMSRLLKTNRTTQDLVNVINAWLNERGWETTIHENKIEAVQNGHKWIIDVHGSKRGRKQPLPVKLNAILNEINDDDAHYSVAFNDSSQYRKQWSEVPRVVKTRLNVSVLLADKSGKIQEVK